MARGVVARCLARARVRTRARERRADDRSSASRRRARAGRRRATEDGAAEDSTDAGGRLSEAELDAAVEEAREILREACAMADRQQREELTRMMSGTSARASAAVEVLRAEALLRGRGLSESDASRVAKELYAEDDLYQEADLLAVQIDRLERAIGALGVDISEMISRSPRTISTDLARATANVMRIRDVFGANKVGQMVMDCPKMLACEDLDDRIERTRACIVKIFSSETQDDTTYAIAEEPNLLFTLPDLPVFARGLSVDISELPMSVQAMLVYATGHENE
ncbi:unnamed product [Ostreococcus tauri]|uniref:Unnamed product n=1 Tax=Ostreococcus tauri TaxID=70448 RepID=A0A096P806_OSTTA|nr:unnamed product [Ostreococcus tauri]CEG00147.1 unnamed product [Ostreococcus tauri]|eukprot:XP_022840223.1 unnamed product [Ostreococcus tauri]